MHCCQRWTPGNKVWDPLPSTTLMPQMIKVVLDGKGWQAPHPVQLQMVSVPPHICREVQQVLSPVHTRWCPHECSPGKIAWGQSLDLFLPSYGGEGRGVLVWRHWREHWVGLITWKGVFARATGNLQNWLAIWDSMVRALTSDTYTQMLVISCWSPHIEFCTKPVLSKVRAP